MTTLVEPLPLRRSHSWSVLLLAAALPLWVSGANGAKAGENRSPTLIVGAPQSARSAPRPRRERHRLEVGMVVIDRRGSRVGLISKINQSKAGRPAVSILINGTLITVSSSKLTIARDQDEAVISLTPSQLRTAAILNTF